MRIKRVSSLTHRLATDIITTRYSNRREVTWTRTLGMQLICSLMRLRRSLNGYFHLLKQRLREMLVRFTGSLPSELSANLSCSVTVCDSEREACLSFVNMGLGVSAAGEVFPTSGDSTAHRYVVNGQIEVVPNDVCPKCYGEWDFKFENPHCRQLDRMDGRLPRLGHVQKSCRKIRGWFRNRSASKERRWQHHRRETDRDRQRL